MYNNMDNILSLFLENPGKEMHIREIARKLKKSPTTISKVLRKYEKAGFLLSEEKMNHILFKANNESRKFKLEKLHYNLDKLVNSGIIEYLEKELNHPEAIGLFGSYAKAENMKNSDIDLFIVTPVKKEINLRVYEKKLNHEIHLMLISRKNIEEMKEKNPQLLNNMINGLMLEGNWEVFR